LGAANGYGRKSIENIKQFDFVAKQKNKLKQQKHILKVLGMGGIGTNQQKHREKKKQENQYSRGLGDGGDWHKAKKNIEKTKKNKKTKTIFQRSWDGGGPTKSFQILFFFVFFWFSRCFFGFLAKNAKTFGKTKKKHIPEVLGTGG